MPEKSAPHWKSPLEILFSIMGHFSSPLCSWFLQRIPYKINQGKEQGVEITHSGSIFTSTSVELERVGWIYGQDWCFPLKRGFNTHPKAFILNTRQFFHCEGVLPSLPAQAAVGPGSVSPVFWVLLAMEFQNWCRKALPPVLRWEKGLEVRRGPVPPVCASLAWAAQLGTRPFCAWSSALRFGGADFHMNLGLFWSFLRKWLASSGDYTHVTPVLKAWAQQRSSLSALLLCHPSTLLRGIFIFLEKF